MSADQHPQASPAKAEPGPATSQTPLVFIVDEESSIRHFVSLVLQGQGVDTMEFADGAALRNARSPRAPDLIFLNVNLDTPDAVHSMEALGKASYPGYIQLMSNRGSAVLENIKHVGEQHKLKMLPVLKKPFETSALQKVLLELKLGFPPPVAARIGLDEALKNNWVEFWFQPKIDLRRKQLTGAETFARVRHPLHGILMPGSFMPGADEASVIALSERAITAALKAGLNFSKVGIHLRMSVNIALNALAKLRVGELVRQHRPDLKDWPGMLIDVTEEQVIPEINLAIELNRKFAPHKTQLAIDDFGRGLAAVSKLKEMPFVEMKLDRAFVTDCGIDKVNAPICKTVIDLAHSFKALAVGVGLEKASEVLALVSMGCDLGQGFLLGQPMPEDRFLSLLRQRAQVRPTPGQTAPASAA